MATNDVSPDNQQAPAPRKNYEKPSFRFEQVFVTSALSCGKISITQSSCTGSGNLKAS
jgi:hypothetical protein